MKNTVVIVDDHSLLSEAVAQLVNSFENFEVIYTCKNGQELITKLKNAEEHPDIILMDINMPILNGIETTEILSQEYPPIPVIALSVEEDENTILKMIKAGAKGYLIKDTNKEVLEQALIETLETGYFHTNTVTQILVDSLHKPERENEFELKERELEFIQLACSDLTYKEIAEKMFLSPKTVDNYRDSVFSKLNVKNRIGMVLFALKNGIAK